MGHSLSTTFWSTKNQIVTFKCASSVVAMFAVFIYALHKTNGTYSGQNSQKSMLTSNFKMPDIVVHPGSFGMPHFTYIILGHTNTFSGMVTSVVIWVLECRASLFPFSVYLCLVRKNEVATC